MEGPRSRNAPSQDISSKTIRRCKLGNGRSRKRTPTQRISEGVREGVREGGFGARILYVGIISPSKIQCIKNFRGGGFSGSRGAV